MVPDPQVQVYVPGVRPSALMVVLSQVELDILPLFSKMVLLSKEGRDPGFTKKDQQQQ